jgi:phosphoribosylaminoimidazole-succinocarboxamide synthase
MTPPVIDVPLAATDLPLPLFARGKVRDVYDVGDALLIVATDRLSAFDCILPTLIPGKGRILTGLSAFWFGVTADLIPNHLMTTEIDAMPGALRAHAAGLEGRAMLVRRARRIDIECVVRGYLAGSAWHEYQRTGRVAGMPLPSGLMNGAALPEPLFTPATKAATGHDENITFEAMSDLVGRAVAGRLLDASLALYARASARAAASGLVLVDTKFEFGFVDGAGGPRLILIDEALTPDSSRYWDAYACARGERVAFDKQIVRDYLLQTGWDRQPPAPPLPAEIVDLTRERYRELYRRITGETAA